MSLPISLLFATTTKGHFDRRYIYSSTLQDWEAQKHLDIFSYKRAHIKNGKEDANWTAEGMREDILSYDFNEVLITEGNFKHFDASHSIGQLQDIGTLIENIPTPYIFFLEDDFLVRAKNNNLEFHIKQSIELLESNEGVSQVRVPRHFNDFPHYKTLHRCHNGWLSQDDIFSFNPYIARTSDIVKLYNSVAVQQDLIIGLINQGILNSELTFTNLARQLRGPYSFWSFGSSNIQCYHIGTKQGEEDKLD